jgi:hypothetical protein
MASWVAKRDKLGSLERQVEHIRQTSRGHIFRHV